MLNATNAIRASESPAMATGTIPNVLMAWSSWFTNVASGKASLTS